MSIKILTRKEALETQKRCEERGEYFSQLIGRAKRDYVCDNSGKAIRKGSLCVACVVSPSYKRFDFRKQSNKLHEFVE